MDGLGVLPGATRKHRVTPSALWWLSAARTLILTRLSKPLINALFLGFREDAGCALLVSDGRRKGGLRLRAGRSGPGGAGTRTRARTRAIKGAANVPGRRPLSHACSADRRSHGHGAVEVPGIWGAVEAGGV